MKSTSHGMASFALFAPEEEEEEVDEAGTMSTGQLSTPVGSALEGVSQGGGDDARAGDSADGGPPRGFVPNQAVGVEPVASAAPADKAPLDMLTDGAARPFCFACEYCDTGKRKRKAGSLGATELAHAHEDIIALVHDGMAREETSRVVDLVHQFYSHKVRPFYSLPEWTKAAIYEHIVNHMRVDEWATQDSISMLNSHIDSLRSCAWTKARAADGRLVHEPHHRNVHLLLKLVQTREVLMTNKRRRAAGGAGGGGG